jgi:hypothetical protein
MPPVGFEPTIPVSEQPHTHTLDRAGTGTGCKYDYNVETFLKQIGVRNVSVLVQLKDKNEFWVR